MHTKSLNFKMRGVKTESIRHLCRVRYIPDDYKASVPVHLTAYCCGVSWCIMIFCIVSWCTVVCRGMLWCAVVCYSVSWCVMVYCSMVWRVVVWCAMLQCVTECRDMSWYFGVCTGLSWCVVLWYVVVFCSLLLCTVLFNGERCWKKKRKHKQMFNSICPSKSVGVLLNYVETTCCSLEIWHIRTK